MKLTGILKILIFSVTVILILFNSLQQAHAIHLSGHAPQYSLGGDPTVPGTLNYEIATAFQSALNDANSEMSKFSKQNKMAGAFGDAASYSSHAAELWGYQGYDKIAIMGGVSASAQMPSLNLSNAVNTFDGILEDGDAQMGVCLSGAINLGLHLGWLSSKARDWYLNVKFFMYDLSMPFSGYTIGYENMTLGVGANYQLVRAKKLGKNLVLWRGISIGTGFLMQKSSLDLEIDIDQKSAELGGSFTDMDVIIEPSLKLGLEMTTYTIPVDIVTSIRLLYFLNISLGAGIDFNFGTSTVKATGSGLVDVSGDPGAGYGEITQGYIEGKSSTENGPFIISGRVMGGVGITAAPAVLLDMTIVYYLTTGVSLNLSVGFAW